MIAIWAAILQLLTGRKTQPIDASAGCAQASAEAAASLPPAQQPVPPAPPPLPELSAGLPAVTRRSDLLLAARLACVARLNLPSSSRAGERGSRTTAANRPVAKVSSPVKTSRPQAWIAARSKCAARPARPAPISNVVEIRGARAPQSPRRATLPIAA